jgi:hypothetical protein
MVRDRDQVIYVAGHRGMVGSALGWQARIGLEAGLRDAYGWYRASLAGNAGP